MSSSAQSSLQLVASARPAVRRPSPLEQEVAGLFDQLRTPLLRYVYAIGLPLHDGEEIIQEVFLALFQHLQQGKSRQNLRGWLFRVAHNLALKRRQRNGRDIFSDAGTADALHYDPAPNPEQALAFKQRRERLRAVVRALPEADRWCLHLRAEGLRYREIAEIVGISLGAVSVMLTRSLERLTRADGG